MNHGHPTTLFKSETGRWRVEYSTGHRRSVDKIASEYIDQLRAAIETAAESLDAYSPSPETIALRLRQALQPPRPR